MWDSITIGWGHIALVLAVALAALLVLAIAVGVRMVRLVENAYITGCMNGSHGPGAEATALLQTIQDELGKIELPPSDSVVIEDRWRLTEVYLDIARLQHLISSHLQPTQPSGEKEVVLEHGRNRREGR